MPFPNEEDQRFLSRATETAIRIGLLALLVAWCFQIVRPFITPVVWGIIIAVATYPLFRKLKGALGGRKKLAATLFTLIALAVLLAPSWIFFRSLASGLAAGAKEMSNGTFNVPAPPESVADWPVVGDKVHALWTQAAEDTRAAAEHFRPQLKAVGVWLLTNIAGLGIAVLQFVASIILAGVFMATAEVDERFADSVAGRLVGPRGTDLVLLLVATVRSVAQGVLGVAAVQALLAGVGLIAAGVPAAGLWTLLVLILAVIQLPPILVMGPMIIYVFSHVNTVGAIVFMIWAILVSVSDTFLKPLFLGRGVKVPMLVILVGAIGGTMAMGILGLFVGAVVLAVGDKVFTAWLTDGEPAPAAAGPAPEGEPAA